MRSDSSMTRLREYRIYRWSPDDGENPRIDIYFVDPHCFLFREGSTCLCRRGRRRFRRLLVAARLSGSLRSGNSCGVLRTSRQAGARLLRRDHELHPDQDDSHGKGEGEQISLVVHMMGEGLTSGDPGRLPQTGGSGRVA